MTWRRLLPAAALMAVAAGCQRGPAPPAERAARPVAAKPAATGSVSGVVRYRGAPLPSSATALPESVHKVCGTTLEPVPLRLAEGHGLQDVVISLENAPAEPSSAGVPGELVIDQKACEYVPPTAAARAGTQLVVVNSDPLLHNVRGQAGERVLFNFAMPVQGLRTRKTLDTPGTVELRCDVHPWMRASIRVFAHRHFATSGDDGRYTLSGLSAGEQKVTFWHPRLSEQVVKVDVPSGGQATLDVEWK